MDETAEYRSTVVSAFENRPQADTAVSELCRAGFREDQIRVEEARYYGESESDRTVVTVKADGRYDEATTILLRHGAFDLHTAAHAPRIAEGAERIQLREEELQVHKQLVETGKVRVRKEVVTEHRTIEVPVQWEEIVIERHAPNGAPVPDSDIGPGEEIHIPVRREQVFVEKRPVVKEEVTVGKRVVQDTEHVGGEVRKEEVRIERVACEGDGDMHTAAPQGTTTAPGSAPPGRTRVPRPPGPARARGFSSARRSSRSTSSSWRRARFGSARRWSPSTARSKSRCSGRRSSSSGMPRTAPPSPTPTSGPARRSTSR